VPAIDVADPIVSSMDSFVLHATLRSFSGRMDAPFAR
jgi:hypothetical protein